MSAVGWQWRDEGSGASGHLQRVASSGTYLRIQRTYRAHLAHASSCGEGCDGIGEHCETGRQLYEDWRAARGPAP